MSIMRHVEERLKQHDSLGSTTPPIYTLSEISSDSALTVMITTIGSNMAPPPLELIFIPFVIRSHIIPLFETARLFATRGQRVTILTIPTVAVSLQTTVAAGHPISIHVLQLPPGGEGLESFHLVTDMAAAYKLFQAFSKLRPEIETIITNTRPDCVISDMFYPWSATFCASLGIPRILFHVSSVIQLCLEVAISNPDSLPYLKLESEDDPFVIPGVPGSIIITRAKLPEFARDPNKPSGLRQQYLDWKESEKNSYGILVNSFHELESVYTDHYERVVLSERVKIINVGPVALIPRSSTEKAERVYKAAMSEDECLSWLNSKEPNSVIYVSFGSTCSFTDVQLMEIAFGLESSNVNFIWVVHGKNSGEDEIEKEKWLPRNFEERVRGRGVIVKGWAPQVIILEHGSVGGFLCHCGWNSLTEAVAAGLPMVTWPIHSEQFYNERLATQVLGIAVEVGAEEWNQYSKGRLVKREKIERAVRKLLDGEDESVKKMRVKVKQLQETAKGAVLEGGSSYKNLTVLIEDLMKIRDQGSP